MTYSRISGAMYDGRMHSVRVVRSIACQARWRYRAITEIDSTSPQPRFGQLLAIGNFVLNALHRSSLERIEAGLEFVRLPVGNIVAHGKHITRDTETNKQQMQHETPASRVAMAQRPSSSKRARTL